MEVLLTGLDIEKKAELYLDAVFHNMGGREQFDDVDVQLIRSVHKDPDSNEVAHAALRVTITGQGPSKFGRIFAAKTTELGLAGIPGNTSRGAAGFNGGPKSDHPLAGVDQQPTDNRARPLRRENNTSAANSAPEYGRDLLPGNTSDDCACTNGS